MIRAAAGVGGEAANPVQSSCATTDGVSSSATSTQGVVEVLEQVAGAALLAAHVHAQPAGDVVQVALALVQVRILDVVEDRGQLVERALHRPFGVHALRLDDRGRAAEQHRIVEHQDLRVEDGGEVRAPQRGDPLADLLELLLGARPGAIERRQLPRDPPGGDRKPDDLRPLNGDERRARPPGRPRRRFPSGVPRLLTKS